MRPPSSASSISLMNRPLPPASDSGRSWMSSPVVLIATISMASGAASTGTAAARASRTRPVWTSASGLPRVPRRRRGASWRCSSVGSPASARRHACACWASRRAATRRRSPSSRRRPAMLRTPVGRILANVVYSQLAEHRRFGGVVPEIAARAHLERIDGLVAEALDEAGLGFADLDGIAATGGPGLIGGVMVGVMTAKAMAFAHDKPFLAVNHLEGHALTVRLTEEVAFPYLLLLVSGGHCQLLAVEGRATSRGSAPPSTMRWANASTRRRSCWVSAFPADRRSSRRRSAAIAQRFALPRPMWRKPGCDFSFSGLKTAVRQTVEKLPPGRCRRPSPISAPRSSAPSATCWSIAAPMRWRMAPHSTRWWWPAASRPTSICAAGCRSWREARRAPGGAAVSALHRQRRHDRLGRHRAAAAGPGRRRSISRRGRAGRSIRRADRPRLHRREGVHEQCDLPTTSSPLFATPIALVEVPDAAALNADCCKAILERRRADARHAA